MALDDLVGSNIHNQEYIPPTGNQGAFMQPGQLPMGQHPLMSGLGSIGGPKLFPPGGDGNDHIKSPGPGFNLPGPIFNTPGLQQPILQQVMPDYSSQFENFGKQLGGFGEQLTGYQDALGSFNEQVGGMGKQFETISNRLDSVDKGLGSLGNQIASLENMQQAQPQQVMQPQRQSYNSFSSPFGFGGLGSLFGRYF